MRFALACLVAICSAASAKAELKLENLRAVLGPLGPERTAWEASPGDDFMARFTLKNLVRDEAGRIQYKTTYKLADAAERPLVTREFTTHSAPSIPGGEDCVWIVFPIPESAAPGKYRLVGEVEDLVGKRKVPFEHELTVADAGLRIAGMQLAYDANFTAPAAPQGLSGQRLYYRATAAGFQRKEGKVSLELRAELTDLTADKPEPSVALRTAFAAAMAPEMAARAPLNGVIALHKVGKYSLRLVLVDQNSGKEASLTMPVVVAEPLGEQAPQAKLVAQPVDAETLAARKLAGQKIVSGDDRPGLVATLEDHKAGVGAAAFSPDGKWLATGGDDGLQSLVHDWDVRLWNWQERKVAKILENRVNQARRLAFNADGKQLALLTRGGDVLVWELESNKRVVEWSRDAKLGRKELFLDFIWAPDGKDLLLAGPAGIARMSVTEAKVSETFGHEKEPLFSLAYAAEKKQLIAGGRQKMVTFAWPSKESRILANPTAELVERIETSPDGRFVTTSRPGQAYQLWNMDLGKIVFAEALQKGEGALAPSPISLVPGSQWLLTAALATLRQHKTDDGTVRQSVTLPHRDPAAIAVSPDGKYAAVGTREGPTHLVRLSTDAAANPIDSERKLAEWLQKINAQFDLTSLSGQRLNLTAGGPLPDEQFRVIGVRFINVPGLTDDSLHNLVAAANLAQISIAGAPQVTGAGFAPLTVLAQLRSVDISRSGFTGDGLKALVRLPNLISLSLNEVSLKPADCDVFPDARTLTSLQLSGTPVSREMLQRIKKMPNLQTLGLVGSGIGDDDLAELSEMLNLLSLNLSSTKVTDAGLVHLTKLAKLRVLTLTSTAVTGEGFAAFPDEQPFSTIYLANTKLKDAALAKVAKFPKLFHLSLMNTPLTDDGLAHLKDAPLFSTLEIGNTAVTGKGLDFLAALPRLNTVIISNIKATPAEIQKFKASKMRNVIP